jgi:hypothetical protein
MEESSGQLVKWPLGACAVAGFAYEQPVVRLRSTTLVKDYYTLNY